MTRSASRRQKLGRTRPELFDPEDERGRLRASFIHRYVRDRNFVDALRQLARKEGDVAAFCRRWGLTFHDNQAEAAVQEWCEERRNWNILPSALLTGFSWGAFKPSNHRLIELEFVWDPTVESRADAEVRLRGGLERRMQAALDGIADTHRCFDEPSRQRRPAVNKHMGWLFRRQRHGQSYEEIAKDARMVAPDAVRMACRRLADRIGLELR